MDITTFFNHVNTAYRGTDDVAPTAGTADYDEWLNVTNRKKNEFATDPRVRWRSLFSNTSVGTAAAGTQNYNLATNFFAPSDQVTVTLAGINTYFQVVPPQERGIVSNSVYISGLNPKVLTFYDAISSTSSFVGGTIYVPGYFIPADLTSASTSIPVNDPYWLVYSVASELAFNDLTYESKTADLVAKANNLWVRMVNANRQGTSGNPRVARYNVNRIPGSRV